MNHSMRVSDLWLRLDFVGIIILTLGDFVSGIYMVFYCEPTLQKVYWTMVRLPALCCIHTLKSHQILTLGVASIYILVSPKFQGRSFRTFRVGTFVFTGLSGLAPLAHGMKLFGFSQMMKRSGMPYYLGEGVVLLLGAFFYTVSNLAENQAYSAADSYPTDADTRISQAWGFRHIRMLASDFPCAGGASDGNAMVWDPRRV